MQPLRFDGGLHFFVKCVSLQEVLGNGDSGDVWVLLGCVVETWQQICLSLLCVAQHLGSPSQETCLAEPLHPGQPLWSCSCVMQCSLQGPSGPSLPKHSQLQHWLLVVGCSLSLSGAILPIYGMIDNLLTFLASSGCPQTMAPRKLVLNVSPKSSF